MIVQCEKCRTKFRIADERVSPNGVKVRCSRCAHVFVARREDGAPTGNTEIPPTAPTEIQLPGFAGQGPDTARLNPSELIDLAARTDPSRADTSLAGAVAGASRISPATTEQAALALGFSGADRDEDEAKTEQAALPRPAPVDPPSWAQDETVAVAQKKGGPPPPLPPPSSDDQPALPKFPAPGSPASNPRGNGATAPSTDDFFPPPPEAPSPISTPFAPPAPASGHGLPPLGGEAPTEGMPGLALSDDVSPFDAGEPEESPFAARTPAAPGSQPGNPFADPPLGARAAPLPTTPSPASSPFASPLDAPPSTSGDIPGLIPPEALGSDDPFGGEDFEDALDDIPPTPAQPVARIDLGKAGVPNLSEKWSHAETTAIAAAYEEQAAAPPPPEIRRELPQVGDRTGLWPSLVGAVLGAALVLTFLPEVGAGILDTFSRRGADAINRVSHQRVLPESLSVMRPVQTHVVAYRIGSGQEVLVVRGAARNLGPEPVRGLSAVALAMDGDTVVARASAPVGVLLDPAVLASLESPSQVAGAYAKRSGGTHELQIEPAGERPFMVVFPEMPGEAKDRVFVVEFVPFDP